MLAFQNVGDLAAPVSLFQGTMAAGLDRCHSEDAALQAEGLFEGPPADTYNSASRPITLWLGRNHYPSHFQTVVWIIIEAAFREC